MSSGRHSGSISSVDAATKTAGGGMPSLRAGPDRIERGHSLGRYLVLEVLGSGGMGIVYLAYDPELERKVAIKVLQPRAGETDLPGSGAADLLREGRAVARLTHPNVVTVFDVGRIGDELFIAMEFVDGKTLSRWASDDKPDATEVLRVLSDAARGLIAAHDAGLVHRDFKPGNVMVDATGRVVVLEFGLAIVQEHEDRDPSAESSTAGTPAYMAPELQLGGAPDAKSDQFAFCVTLYQTLCGKHPFGDRGMALLHAMFTTDAREPPADAMPAHVWGALRRGLARAPETRHDNMRDLLAALKPRQRASPRWVLAGLLGLVGIASVVSARDEPPCSGGEASIAKVWPGDVRGALRATHQGEDPLPIESELDTYAAAWAASTNAACKATHVDKTQSSDLLDLRVACLGRRRAELAALLDSASDARVSPSKLREAAVSLEPPNTCDDADRLLTIVAPPSDPATRQTVESLFAEAAGISSRLQLAIDPRVALAQAVGLRARAEAIGYPPLIARAAMLHETGLRNLQLPEAAIEPSMRSLLAAEAGRDDAAALEAAVDLAYLYAIQHRPEDAARWLAFADAKLARLPGNHSAEVSILTTRGLAQRKRGEFAASVESLGRALDFYTDGGQPTDARRGNILASLALSYRAVGEHTRAIETGRRAIQVRSELFGAGHPLVGESLFNLAMAQVADDDSEAALESLARARTTLLDDDPRSRRAIVFDGQTGVALAASGDLEGAQKLFERGLELGREVLGPDHFDLNPLLVNLARLELMRGKPRRALEHALEAIAIANAHYGSDFADMTEDLLILAEIYTALERTDEAIESYRRAHRIAPTDADRERCALALAKLSPADEGHSP